MIRVRRASMTTRRELLDMFARCIWLKARTAQRAELTVVERRTLMRSIGDDIRKGTINDISISAAKCFFWIT